MSRTVRSIEKKGFFFLGYVSSKRQCRNYVGPLQNEDDQLRNRDIDHAEIFNAFFASLVSTENGLSVSQHAKLKDRGYENEKLAGSPGVCGA